MPPTLRPDYANSLRSLLIPGWRAAFLELVYRREGPEQLTNGPPFHIQPNMVRELYGGDADCYLFEVDLSEVETFKARAPGSDRFVRYALEPKFHEADFTYRQRADIFNSF
jgi:hypothetical protein